MRAWITSRLTARSRFLLHDLVWILFTLEGAMEAAGVGYTEVNIEQVPGTAEW